MKRFPLVMMMVCFAVLQLNAQFSFSSKKDEAPNFFIITTDGLRWQELFNGMQDDIVNQKNSIVAIVIICLIIMVVQLQKYVVKN